jgi:hypothetical protein
MNVELLHIAECPNTQGARCLLRNTLQELGLPAEIHEIEVTDTSQAETLRFPGSPTIRIDGIDVEAAPPRRESYGVSCRTYLIEGRLRGLPTKQMVRSAIWSAVVCTRIEAKRS